MSDASFSSGIAARYATALFEIAKEGKRLPAIEKDLDALAEALDASPELTDALASPAFTRDETTGVVTALAKKMKLGKEVSSTLGLMASKGRAFCVPALITSMREMIAREKGEVTAEVRAAKALTKAQSDKLAKTLKAQVGSDVKINVTVDESLIGGLIVKVGSKMIDSSIASRLANLQNAMKEVG